MFVLSQSIALGFTCLRVKYIGNLVMVHGLSSEIKFYEFDGSAYASKFSIITSNSAIYESVVSDNGNKFMFGGNSQNISTYALEEDGSYALAEQLETGIPILRLYVDPAKLYFLITTTGTVVDVLFRCP